MSIVWDSRAIPGPEFSCLYQWCDDWISQRQLGNTLPPEPCFLLRSMGRGQSYSCMLQSAPFPRGLRKHAAADTSCCREVWALLTQSQIVGVSLIFMGSKHALPGQWHDEGSYGGIHCWIELKCWKDKKGTSALYVLDCTIPYCLPVLFLHFRQSCICTPQGSILALLHYKGFISWADQYLCAYLKPFFHLKWPLPSGSTFLWGRLLRFVCICMCFSKLLLKKVK